MFFFFFLILIALPLFHDIYTAASFRNSKLCQECFWEFFGVPSPWQAWTQFYVCWSSILCLPYVRILSQCFSFSVHFACIFGKIPQLVFNTTHSMLSSNKSALSCHTSVEFNSALHFYFLKTLSLSLPSLILLPFPLSLFSCQLFPLSWNLSLCIPRSLVENVSWLGRASFLEGCSPSGSWRYCPCSLSCSISNRSLDSLDPFSLLLEKGGTHSPVLC